MIRSFFRQLLTPCAKPVTYHGVNNAGVGRAVIGLDMATMQYGLSTRNPVRKLGLER